MPQYNEYERDGRRLMVEFTCRRCGRTRVEPLERSEPNEVYGYLHDLKTPEGWKEVYGLFCPDCVESFISFMTVKPEIQEQEPTI